MINETPLEQFPIILPATQMRTSAPTHEAPEGTLTATDEAGTYKLYIRISKGWREVTLT